MQLEKCLCQAYWFLFRSLSQGRNSKTFSVSTHPQREAPHAEWSVHAKLLTTIRLVSSIIQGLHVHVRAHDLQYRSRTFPRMEGTSVRSKNRGGLTDILLWEGFWAMATEWHQPSEHNKESRSMKILTTLWRHELLWTTFNMWLHYGSKHKISKLESFRHNGVAGQLSPCIWWISCESYIFIIGSLPAILLTPFWRRKDCRPQMESNITYYHCNMGFLFGLWCKLDHGTDGKYSEGSLWIPPFFLNAALSLI